ncbi:MAG: TonB-dependent receptor plug domain-containing protein, partial [Muribaculaceae bacterium]|nr:TonB-dependent receptor plug domain-containing protein [Muribaculaceae bacterium]
MCNVKTKVASILLLSAAQCLSVTADEAVDAVELQSVTVTAIKGGSSVPAAASVSTINAAEARRLHIESLKGAADVVPNMFVPDYGSRITSSIYVRGIGARMDQPAVGLNVDNVPFLNKDAYDFDLQDIKDLQVLRGPQSTLYGRNTMAGVVNINTLLSLIHI